jgi:hypothetical protein
VPLSFVVGQAVEERLMAVEVLGAAIAIV